MFCSKCGKTVKLSEASCPFCGTPVGDSRFEGNGYTAAQPRFTSDSEADSARNVVPYTRTTYTGAAEEGAGEDESGDVFSRTTYRPVYSEAPADKGAPEAEGSVTEELGQTLLDEPLPTRAERAGRTEKHAEQSKPVHKRATMPVYEVAPGEDPDDDIKIEPLRPIKKTGISPEVRQYMEQMDTQQAQPKRSLKTLFNRAGDSEGGVESAPAAPVDAAAKPESDPLGVIQEGADEVVVHPDGTVSLKRGAPGWLKPVAIVLCIGIILAVAAYVLILNFANTSQLEGVGFDLRDQGLKLIKSHTENAYRTELIKLVDASDENSLNTLNAKLEESHDAIVALMPDKPLPNDELFVKTLDSIQDTIDDAVGQEAVASITGVSEYSDAQWAVVNNAIAKLESAREATELRGIIGDTELALATPEPTVTPEPDKYKTLKRGINNNKDVNKLQKRLKALGWFKGNIDSDYGPLTEQTIKRFKEAAGITPADGIADSATQEAIYADDAPRASKTNAKVAAATPTPPAGDVDVSEVLDEAID